MTLASAIKLDQQPSEQQDVAIEDLYSLGIVDGYDGKPCACEDYAYHVGYAEGLQRYNEELIRQCQQIFAPSNTRS